MLSSPRFQSNEIDEGSSDLDRNSAVQVDRKGLFETASLRLGRPLLWVVLAVVSVIPTVAFLLLAFSPRIFAQGSSWFTLSAFGRALSGNELAGMRNSLGISTAAAISAVVLSSLLALIVQQVNLRESRWIPGLLWVILLVPTYVTSVGWNEVVAPGSIFSQLGLVSQPIRNLLLGTGGIIMILTFTGVPFAYFAISPAIRGLGRRFEEASRIHGGSIPRTIRIVTPILLPAIFAGATIVFAESLGDFGVASTIAANANIPVATTNIMSAIATFPTDFPMAAGTSWLLVLTLGVVLTIQNRMTRSRSYGVLSGRTAFAPVHDLSKRAKLAVRTFLYLFVLAALGVPIFGALISTLFTPYRSPSLSSLTLNAYTTLFRTQSIGGPILTSLTMAAIAATITIVLGISIAKVLTSPRPGLSGKFTDLILVTSVALPGLVLAAGFIFVFNLPATIAMGINIYGTMILLGIGYVAISLPSNAKVMVGPISQLDGSLMRAGRIHGASMQKAFRRCVLPLLAKSIVWAWLLTFASTFGELPTSQMLAPTGVRTMATAILSSFEAANVTAATAFSIIQMGIVLGVIVLVQGGFRYLAPKGWQTIVVHRK